MDPPPAGARRQAEQWMRVAEKLLMAKDLEGCKEFSSQALAADSCTPGAEDLHAAADVLLAAQRRRMPNGQPNPYAVLGIDPANPASRHPDVVHSSYRRLSLLLNRSHQDRPYSVSVAEAARHVTDAWNFLSNPGLKSALDTELDAAAPARAYRAPAQMQQQQPQPSPRPQQSAIGAAPQPRPSPQRSPIPAVHQPPPQPSPLRAAPQPPARAVAPPPLPQQSTIWAAPLPPARAAAPPPLPQQTAAPQPRPPPQQSPIPAAHQPPLPQQPSPPRADPQSPAGAVAQPEESGTPPSPTFWTVCKVCSHIHQYDRLYEARKLRCSSCHQPFVAEAMAETPPIVPGTDMYYCTWGFFPIGFPGCPGFETLVNKQPQGPDQLNAPWLGANGVVEANGDVEDNGGADVQNGTPVSPSGKLPVVLEPAPEPLMSMRVEVPAAPEPVMSMRVEVPAAPEPVMPTRVEVPAAPEPVMPTRVEVPAAPEPVMPTRVEVPAVPAPVMPMRVEVPAAPKPVKTMALNSVNVGAKKRGRPKGSKNKKKKN
uniref:Uncharacterized protein n=1 Tax=Avena sativa TaxID=4498 RepID=A0ACD5Y1G5_AVESA